MGRAEVIIVDNGSRPLPEAVVGALPRRAAGLGGDRPAPARRATAAWR